MALHTQDCQIFDCPNVWSECTRCRERFEIDFDGFLGAVEVEIIFYSCMDYLDLAIKDVNLHRWRKDLKSFVLVNDPLSKQQLDALGLLDVILETFDHHYSSGAYHQLKGVVEWGVMNELTIFLERTIYKFDIPGYDVALSLRKMLKMFRRIKIFQIEPHLRYLVKIVERLLPELYKHCRENNSELVVEFMETVFSHPSYQEIIFSFTDDVRILEFLMRHANARKFDFWGMYSGKLLLQSNPTDVYVDEEEKSLESVRVMMKYGYRPGMWTPNNLLPILGIPHDEISWHGHFILKSLYNYDRFAMYMYLLLLGTFSNRQPNEEHMELVNLLNRDTSEPFITQDQLLEFMRLVIKPELRPRYLNACEEYNISSCFGESYDGYEPRSLKHLSRVVVREHLRENHQLPHGIKQLGLPETLQNYVNLDLVKRNNN